MATHPGRCSTSCAATEAMRRAARILLVALVATAFVAALDVAGVGGHRGYAVAQQNGQKRVNLFDLLFGGALKRLPQIQRQQQQRLQELQQRARRVIAPDSNTEFAGGQTAAKTVLTKNEDALRVLVVGDFMASGLYWGLDQAFAENPGVEIVDQSAGLSGFTRDDVVNWPEKLGQLLLEQKPVAVVILIGMNDRQNIRLGQQRFDKLTPEWRGNLHGAGAGSGASGAGGVGGADLGRSAAGQIGADEYRSGGVQ